MKIEQTAIPDVLLLTPTLHQDDRGSFYESFNQRTMAAAGLPTNWVQDNFSTSKRNVLRGIHYQITHPQGKLVRVTHGRVLDVAVDLRRGSPDFARSVMIELSGDDSRMVWIPEGFGHGFLVLSEVAGFAYKVTDFYSAEGERTIAWDDPDLNIPWPVAPADVIVSAKDRMGFRLCDSQMFP